jgi:hypothetical protein
MTNRWAPIERSRKNNKTTIFPDSSLIKVTPSILHFPAAPSLICTDFDVKGNNTQQTTNLTFVVASYYLLLSRSKYVLDCGGITRSIFVRSHSYKTALRLVNDGDAEKVRNNE